MCFIIAVTQQGVAKTTEQLAASLRKKRQSALPSFTDYHLVSIFSHPLLPVITHDQIVLKEWGFVPSRVKTTEDALVEWMCE
jgi:hypothetical protein